VSARRLRQPGRDERSPGVKKLRDDIGVTEKTIDRALAYLRDEGWIERTRAGCRWRGGPTSTDSSSPSTLRSTATGVPYSGAK
jgi:DNA-binding transcriptional MocR family regulator